MSNILKLFLSHKGRINRPTYAAAYFSALVCSVVLYKIFLESTFITNIIIAPALMIMLFHLSIKRFHDVGRSGWYSLLFCVPFVNFLTFLYLLFKKGTKDPNRLGPPPSSKAFKDKDEDDIVFEHAS